jgi:hypothetical protein
MRNVHTLGMRSMQLSESVNSDMKNHLKSDLDIIHFFKHLERVVQEKRNIELNVEYESRKKLPRIKMRVPILLQTSKIYTPSVFEQFQNEFEKSMAAYIKALEQQNEFTIAIDTMQKGSVFVEECKVISNYSEQSVSCSCRQFKRIGLLCSHALKVLDILNTKSLPEHYILKRWS